MTSVEIMIQSIENNLRNNLELFLKFLFLNATFTILSYFPPKFIFFTQILAGKGDDCFVEVPELPPNDAAAIVMHWMNSGGRCLTQQQFDTLMAAFAKCPVPLFLKVRQVTCCRYFVTYVSKRVSCFMNV